MIKNICQISTLEKEQKRNICKFLIKMRLECACLTFDPSEAVRVSNCRVNILPADVPAVVLLLPLVLLRSLLSLPLLLSGGHQVQLLQIEVGVRSLQQELGNLSRGDISSGCG